MGTHLMMRTETGTLEVHVGPSAYVARQQFPFAKGDTIEVTGSKTTLHGDGCLAGPRNPKGRQEPGSSRCTGVS